MSASLQLKVAEQPEWQNSPEQSEKQEHTANHLREVMPTCNPFLSHNNCSAERHPYKATHAQSKLHQHQRPARTQTVSSITNTLGAHSSFLLVARGQIPIEWETAAL